MRDNRKQEGEYEDLGFWKDFVFFKVANFCYAFNKDIMQYPLQFTFKMLTTYLCLIKHFLKF